MVEAKPPYCVTRKVSLLRADRSVNRRGTSVGRVIEKFLGDSLDRFGGMAGLWVASELFWIQLRAANARPGIGGRD